MARNLILACILIGSVPSLLAQNPEQLFDQANKLYHQGKLAEARETYESILRNGLVSGPLYYNLGNVYYRTGNVGKAILNYERAYRLMPNDEDVRHNLQLANLLVADRIEPTPRLFIWDYWDNMKDAFTLQTLTWVTYLFYTLLIMSIASGISVATFRGRKLSLIAAGVSACLFFLSVVLFIAKIDTVSRDDTAIVTANVTTIKNSPDSKSTDAFVLHTGVKVQITERVSDWIKIRLADGKVGWMESSAAEVI